MSYLTRKQRLGQFAVGTGIVVIGFVVLACNIRWIISAVQGPVPITLAELRQLQDPGTLSNPWVSFTFTQAIDTKLGISTSRRGGPAQPRSKYLLVQVQDRWLITEVPHNHAGNRVVGYVDVWQVPLRQQAIDRIKAEQPNEAGLLLPFQVDGEYGYRGQCGAMAGIVVTFVAIGLFLMVKNRATFSEWLAQQRGKTVEADRPENGGTEDSPPG